MKYKEIKIYPKREELNALVEALNAAGRTDLVINDPGELEGIMRARDEHVWDYVDPEVIEDLQGNPYVCFYLQEGEDDSAAMDIAKGFDFTLTHVDDEDWLHKWEEYYVPFNITPDIVVKPVWRDYDAKEGELVIDIDPGLAFGTGSSPTTYLAARLLEKYMEPGMDVIDAGCGTGILSVIASKCGARDVLALDIDPEAVLSTENNAKLNGCGNISAREADLLKGVEYKADLVIGNLLAPLVMRLSEDIPSCGKEGVLFVASGIIDDMEEECLRTVKANGFEILELVRDDCWTAFAARYAGRHMS